MFKDTNVIIDTHKSITKLMQSGMSEKQAETVITLFADSHNHLATKDDMKILDSRVDTLTMKIDALEMKIDALEPRLTLKIASAVTILLVIFEYLLPKAG